MGLGPRSDGIGQTLSTVRTGHDLNRRAQARSARLRAPRNTLLPARDARHEKGRGHVVQDCFLTSFIFAAAAFAEDYGSDWLFQKSLVINTGPSGANTASLVRNFPLLVRLTALEADVFAEARAGGADGRFSTADGTTPLPYQIENWNASGREAEIWVKVDSVLPGNGLQSIRMFWGNDTASDSSNGRAVFDTAAGFQAVYHMDGTGDESEATPNGITATAVNAPGATASGAVGPARTLSGSAQYFIDSNTASGPLNFHMTDSYTISAWIYPAAITSSGTDGNAILDKGNDQYILQAYSNGSVKRWNFTTRGNNTFLQDTSAGSLTAQSGVGGWHHLMGVYHGAATGGAIAESLYYDGNLANALSATNSNTTGRGESQSVFIGALGSGTAPNGGAFSRYWNGSLDEMEVSSQARSASWARLSFATQAPGATCVRSGPTLSLQDEGADPNVAGVYKTPGSALAFVQRAEISVFQPGEGVTFLDPSGLTTSRDVMASGNVESDSVLATSMVADSITANVVVTTPKWQVPDYVFEKGYRPLSLKDLESYLRSNHHLPGFPSARDMKGGMNVGDMNLRLLKSVEDLTLHVIELNKQVEAQDRRGASLESSVRSLSAAPVPGPAHAAVKPRNPARKPPCAPHCRDRKRRPQALEIRAQIRAHVRARLHAPPVVNPD